MSAETKGRVRMAGRILFLIYMIALIYFLFLSEWYGRNDFSEQEYRYNLVPFREIRRFWIYRHAVGFRAAFLNLAGNVIGFMPFGFILPVMSRKFQKFPIVLGLGFLLSLIVETVQLTAKVGCFDVDDLMLNTLGAMLGYWSFCVCNGIRRLQDGKKKI